MRRIVTLAVLLAACPLAFAQAYKWKDAQGVTHYSDSPPPMGTKYDKVKTTGTVEAPAGANPTAPPTPAPPKAAPAGPASDTPENRQKLCATLRSNMEILSKQQQVSVDDGKGGQVALDDAGRKRQIETTQAQMTLYCK
ncbi:DUF4124 domain-containing protein [Luteibacter yeojuensis]|uniref:DUF4124 domain-containing protein n=1 Tax=Luteibacter yeojuensis TaxID=345309 RepID=A0A7X5QU99_9GAMM|nr:DUF4124 domain-containing protein [Luteibacter yeojuensis]NID15521.1 DUF4124 domain-containing protein [Luteibacter yeojuensis]